MPNALSVSESGVITGKPDSLAAKPDLRCDQKAFYRELTIKLSDDYFTVLRLK